MAGVPAGRLSIEIVAEVARLASDLQKVQKLVNSSTNEIARSARAANDNLAGVGRNAGSGLQMWSREVRKVEGASDALGRSLGNLKGLMASFGIALGAAGLAQGARTYLQLADQAKSLTAQLRLATAATGDFAQAQEDVRAIAATTRSDLESTTKLYGNFMRNAKELGISQGEAARATETVAKAFKVSGATAVEASQGTRQLVQALQSGVLRGDEFNTIMEAAPRLSKLFADSLDVTVGELRKMAEEGELTSDRLTRALTDKEFTAGLDAEFRQMPVTFDEAMTQISNAAIVTFGAFDSGGQFSTTLSNFILDGTNGFADLETAAENFGRTLRAEFAGISAIFSNAITEIGRFKAVLNSIPGTGGGAIDRAQSIVGDILNPLGAIVRASPAYRNAKDQSLKDTAPRGKSAIELALEMQSKALDEVKRAQDSRTSSLGNMEKAVKSAAKSGRANAAAMSEEAKAALKAHGEAVRYLESLERQNEEFGKTREQLRALADARAIDAAGTDEQLKLYIRLAIAARGVNEALAELTKTMSQTLNKSAAEDWAKVQERASQATKDRTQEAVDAAEKQAEWNAQIEHTVSLLDQLGERGRGLGSILLAFQGLQTGDFSGVPGAAGVLLQQLSGISWRGDDGEIKKLGQEIFKQLDSVFGSNGTFAETMNNLFQGAGTGIAIGSIMGGSKGSQLGSMIGGALGQEFGKQAIGAISGSLLKSLGSAAGPIGAIAGSLLGGLVGGLFSGNRSASAHVSGGGITTQGADKANYSGAFNLGKAVEDAIGKIGDAFGSEVGDFLVSIGLRGDQIRLNASGTSTSLKIKNGAQSFGQDAEAAVMAAIAAAIEQGAFQGLSKGITDYLLGGDLQKRLDDVLSLKAVQNEAAQLRDPQAFALEALDKWRDQMVAIATATGEGLADIEFVYGERRKTILEQVGQTLEDAAERERAIRDKNIELLVAQGKVEEATAAARQAQLDDMPEYLRAIQMQINTANDAAAAQARLTEAQELAARAADERQRTLAGLQAEYLDLTGDTLGAMRLRFEESIKGIVDEDILNAMRVNFGLEYAQAQNRANEAAQQATRAANDNALAVGALASVTNELAAANDNLLEQREQELAAARGVLADAYERERSELLKTIETWDGLAKTLREARAGLFSIENGFENLSSLRSRFYGAAASRDAETLAGVPSAATAYLEQFRGTTATLAEYQMEVARVARAVEDAAVTADGERDTAELHLDMLDRQVGEIAGVREEVKSLKEAIAEYNAKALAQGEQQIVISKGMESRLNDLERKFSNVTAGGTEMAIAA